MESENSIQTDTENSNDDNSIIDITEELTKFISYLKTNENSRILLNLSEIELQNEIKFIQRSNKILKHHHRHDQIMTEEKIINELQQSINVITSNLDDEMNKEISEPNNIAEIYQNIMTLKMLSVRDSKNFNDLEEFIKINKINLKQMAVVKNEIQILLDKLLKKDESSKKSDIKVEKKIFIPKDGVSSISLSNISRRNNQDVSIQIQPRMYAEFIRSEHATYDNMIEPKTFANSRSGTENDQTKIIIRSNVDQTRSKQNDDFMSNDLAISCLDDDSIEFSSLNSNANLSKENEDINNGDVHLILNPCNSWLDT